MNAENKKAAKCLSARFYANLLSRTTVIEHGKGKGKGKKVKFTL
jgi:hypothetical protein